MTSAFQDVFGSLFHAAHHFGRKNYFYKVTRALCQNNLLKNLFHTTRHSEQSKESLNEILRLKPQGATHVGTFDNNRHAAFTLAEDATHVGMFDKNRRAAFTLAEVLITLGIIGVVAALTIPTLIANYKKKQAISKLQKNNFTVIQKCKDL